MSAQDLARLIIETLEQDGTDMAPYIRVDDEDMTDVVIDGTFNIGALAETILKALA